MGLAAACALAALLRWPSMTRGLGYDELFTMTKFVDVDAWRTVSTYLDFNNHVAYSLSAKLAVALLGRSEWAIRLPAFVLGIGGVAATWWLGRTMAGGVVGVLAAGLLAISPPHVLWSVSARGYTGMILCSTVATVAFLRWRTWRSPWTTAYVAASGLGAWFHLFGLMVTLSHALLAVAEWRRHSVGRTLLPPFLPVSVAAGGLTVLLHAPLLPGLFNSLRRTAGGSFAPLFPHLVVDELLGHVGSLPELILSAFVGVGWWWLARHNRRHGWLLGISLLAPLLIGWVARPIDLFARFYVYWLPLLCIALATGLCVPSAALAGVRRRVAMVLSGAAMVMAATLWVARSGSIAVDEGFRAAAISAAEGLPASSLLCGLGGGAELFQFYLPDRPAERLVVPESLADFQRQARRVDEIRCLYRPVSWEPRYHTEIAKLVGDRGSSTQFSAVVLLRAPSRQIFP